MDGNSRSSHHKREAERVLWFKPCAGCTGERPVVFWCQECKAGFCMEDFEARHSVGAYRHHKETAGQICKELYLQCDDCGETRALTSLTFCHQCNQFLCEPCDHYCHNNASQSVAHIRQRYVVEAGGWIFYCSGCTPEQRAVIDPSLWCYDCNKAYCREHFSIRHLTGQFQKHKSSIEPIRAELQLPCMDCKDLFTVDSMKYCNECEAMFCKVCCRFRHNDLAASVSHSISTYHRTGVVKAVSETQHRPSLFLRAASFVCQQLCDNDIYGERMSGQTASSSIARSYAQSSYSNGRPSAHSSTAGMIDIFLSEGSMGDKLALNDEATSPPPTAGPPQQSMELKVFLEMLREGLLVTRYATSGEGKNVVLVLAAEDTKFCYHPTQRSFSTKDPKARHMAVECVVEVRAGTDPDPEYPEFGGTPVLRQGCKPVHANRALSLIAELPSGEGEDGNDEEKEVQIVTWDFEFANARDQQISLHGLREFLTYRQQVAQWEAARMVALELDVGIGEEELMKVVGGSGPLTNEGSEVRHSLNLEAAEAKYSFGLRRLKNGSKAQAIEAFNKCLHFDGEHTGALYELGHLYQDMGDLDVAVHYFQKALAVNPSHCPSCYSLGVVGVIKGDLQKAEHHLKKALELEPDNVDTLVNLGLVEMTRKEYSKAKSIFEQALPLATVKQQELIVLYNLGNLAHATGKNMTAVDYFNRALDVDPEHTDTLFNRGVAYQETKQYQKAYDSFQKAAELNPGMEEAKLAATNLQLHISEKLAEQSVMPEAKRWWQFKQQH